MVSDPVGRRPGLGYGRDDQTPFEPSSFPAGGHSKMAVLVSWTNDLAPGEFVTHLTMPLRLVP